MVARAMLLSHVEGTAVVQFLLRRAPHHYNLATFTRREWLCPFTALVMALPVLGTLVPGRERIRAIVLTGLTLLLLGYVGFRLESSVIVQLRVWRIAVPLYTLLLTLACETLVRAVRHGGWGVRAWLLAPMCLFYVARFDDAFIPHSGPLLKAVLPILCLAALAMRFPRLREWAAGASALACVLAAVLWLRYEPGARVNLKGAWAHAYKWNRFRLRAEPGRAERELYRRIRGHLPANARLLTPPTLGDFRLFARRAMYVDWKSTPMRGDEALEWQRRIDQTAGGPLRTLGFAQRRELNARYAMRGAEQLARLARREHLTHVVAMRELPLANRSGLTKLWRAGRYVVYAVGPSVKPSADTQPATAPIASGSALARPVRAPKLEAPSGSSKSTRTRPTAPVPAPTSQPKR
jgi:hypothetical protein